MTVNMIIDHDGDSLVPSLPPLMLWTADNIHINRLLFHLKSGKTDSHCTSSTSSPYTDQESAFIPAAKERPLYSYPYDDRPLNVNVRVQGSRDILLFVASSDSCL